jgi:hypothetical protein
VIELQSSDDRRNLSWLSNFFLRAWQLTVGWLILKHVDPHSSTTQTSSLPNAMSTVSRICLRCRIRIFNNGPILPSASALRSRRAGQRSLMSARSNLHSRAFSAKASDTPGKASNTPENVSQSKAEEYPLADPVRVKLNAHALSRARSDRPDLSRRAKALKAKPLAAKPLTTTDVEKFLAKVKRAKEENDELEEPVPSGKDASKVDKTYEMLLGNSMPLIESASPQRIFTRLPARAPVRQAIDPADLPPVLRDALSKCDFAPADLFLWKDSDVRSQVSTSHAHCWRTYRSS